MYRENRFCCAFAAEELLIKQFYTKLFIYNTVILVTWHCLSVVICDRGRQLEFAASVSASAPGKHSLEHIQALLHRFRGDHQRRTDLDRPTARTHRAEHQHTGLNTSPNHVKRKIG